MKLLLDTHIVIWYFDKDSPLKQETRSQLEDVRHQLIVSVATLWEIGIKRASGKLKTPDNLIALLNKNDMAILPITADHAEIAYTLPRRHGDPFDRMLVAQAMFEELTIMTSDRHIQSYNVSCLMV